MKKKFYTYEEILLALREEYIKNQELLKKLEKYIYVIEDENINLIKFKSTIGQINNDYFMSYSLDSKMISLVLLERLNIIKRMINRFMEDEVKNRIKYNVVLEDNGNYGIKEVSRGDLVWFDPTIIITDQKYFNEIVNEILNSEFMNLQNERFPSMFGYKICFTSEKIRLGNESSWVLYNAVDDVINTWNIKNSDSLECLIRQYIPECYLNDRVKRLVDKNLKEDKFVDFDSCNLEFNSKLKIMNTDKGIKLRKLKK